MYFYTPSNFSDISNSLSLSENSEAQYSSKGYLGIHCFIKLGSNITSSLSKAATFIANLANQIMPLLSSIGSQIYELTEKLLNIRIRKKEESSIDLNAISNKISTSTLPILISNDQQVLINKSSSLLEKENDDEGPFYECKTGALSDLSSDGEIFESDGLISDNPDDDEDLEFFDCLEDSTTQTSSEKAVCDQSEKSRIEDENSVLVSSLSLDDADPSGKSTTELNSQKRILIDDESGMAPAEVLPPPVTDIFADRSIPAFSQKLVALLNLILKNPIDSLSNPSKVKKIDENVTEYTFHLSTKREFNKRIPSGILSLIPALDYNHLSLSYKAMAICASKLFRIHSPSTLSFILSLDKKQETATLIFLNAKDTLSVNLNFGLLGNYGTIYIHEIRYDKKKSEDSDSTVYFKESTANWDQSPSKRSDEDDDLLSAFNSIKYNLSTKTISDIWSSLTS